MKTRYAKILNKAWWDMTPREQEMQFKEFDKPINPRDLKPLSRRQRLLWDRMRTATPHVSIRVHDGKKEVVIRLEDDLLNRATLYARKKKTTLPRLIDRGLRRLLASAE
jgi:hypothetical protein